MFIANVHKRRGNITRKKSFLSQDSNLFPKFQLGFDGVKISSLVIESIKSGKQNQINTSWDESDCNLKNGLNFQPDVDIYARIKHLQHEEFQYVFDIENSSASQQSGTVRIFLAQKNNVRDRELTFEEIRMLMIELDRFTVNRMLN